MNDELEGSQQSIGRHMSSIGVDNSVSSFDMTETENVSKTDIKNIARLFALGFLVSCQPSEPYLTQYLHENKGLNDQQLNSIVWPFDTYGFFLFLIPAGLLAEVIGYRTVILGGLLCREATRLVLLFAEGVGWMATMQLTYAAATATNLVYFAYVYMVVESVSYQRATSCVSASIYVGDFVGSVVSQILMKHSFVSSHLQVLFYLSWVFTTLGLLYFLCCFPAPTKISPMSLHKIFATTGMAGIRRELNSLYEKPILRYTLLLWWVIGFSCNQIVGNYFQNQLYDLDKEAKFGAVEALMGLSSALGSFLPLLCSDHTIHTGIVILLVLTSTFLAVLFQLCAGLIADPHDEKSRTLHLAYVLNILIPMVFACQYAMVSSVIAREITSNRFSIVFTFNSFISMAFTCILQAVAGFFNISTNAYYQILAIEQYVLIAALLASVYFLPRIGYSPLVSNNEGDAGNTPPFSASIESIQ